MWMWSNWHLPIKDITLNIILTNILKITITDQITKYILKLCYKKLNNYLIFKVFKFVKINNIDNFTYIVLYSINSVSDTNYLYYTYLKFLFSINF